MVMTFDYYYGAQAEQFNFIRIPKAMIVDPMFADLIRSSEVSIFIFLSSLCSKVFRKSEYFSSSVISI